MSKFAPEKTVRGPQSVDLDPLQAPATHEQFFLLCMHVMTVQLLPGSASSDGPVDISMRCSQTLLLPLL